MKLNGLRIVGMVVVVSMMVGCGGASSFFNLSHTLQKFSFLSELMNASFFRDLSVITDFFKPSPSPMVAQITYANWTLLRSQEWVVMMYVMTLGI